MILLSTFSTEISWPISTKFHVDSAVETGLFVRLSLLTMTSPNQPCDMLLFVCSKMADETNLSSKLPAADRTREV